MKEPIYKLIFENEHKTAVYSKDRDALIGRLNDKKRDLFKRAIISSEGPDYFSFYIENGSVGGSWKVIEKEF